MAETAAKDQTFFDGIDTTLPGLYRALRKPSPAGAESLLTAIDRELQSALELFKFTDPSTAVPPLARALAATRAALEQLGRGADVRFVLGLKEQQIADAMDAALGISLTATAQPAGTPQPSGPLNGGPRAMAAVVPGQTFDVRTVFVNRGRLELQNVRTAIESKAGSVRWAVSEPGSPKPAAQAAFNQPI